MKGKRQEKILEIIRTNDIETQEELTKKLSEAGFSSTQGTISRDIRELKLTKVTAANGKQKYAPIQTEDIHVSSKYKRVLSEGILHMDNAEIGKKIFCFGIKYNVVLTKKRKPVTQIKYIP